MEFTELNLHEDVQKGITEAGFTTCMPVQEMVFAHSLTGEDIYAQSQTGTGKTAAFLISIFQRIMTQSELRTKKALILAPTRELAVQIEAESKKLGKFLPISVGAFYGGVSYGPQIDMLRADVQIIVGTPGRIIDLLRQGKMILKEVGFLVVDEADRMFDMGFIDDLRRLLRYLPPPEKRQTYLFSATLGLKVKELAWEYMREPKEIVIEPERMTVELVTQELYHVGNHEKFPALLGILDREKPKSAIIFCNQKYMVEELARRLQINGIECEYIMGDLPQSRRLAIIDRLKAGQLEILVATDVAARGLDVEALDLVVNYDVPEDPESYVHRIGRTARAGKSGKAVTLACERFVYGLPAIEEFINARIPVLRIEENLLLEDKSAHVRFPRDRDRSRGGHEGRPRRDGRRADGRREMERGGRRREEREDFRRADERRDRPRSDQAPRRPARSEAGGEGGRGGEDLYSLPQDQRIRMYKEKYGPKPERAPETPGAADGRGPARKGGGADRRPAPASPQAQRPGAPAKAGGSPAAQPKAAAAKGGPKPAAARPAAASAGTPAGAQERAPAKGGIFARIKKLFGGK